MVVGEVQFGVAGEVGREGEEGAEAVEEDFKAADESWKATALILAYG